MTDSNNKTSSIAWGDFYKGLEDSVNFFPENFIARIFLSKHPVQFLEGCYDGLSILDLGCGHGRHLPFLSNIGFANVDGLEVSADQVAKLQQQFPQSRFYCGTSSDIGTDDGVYDFVMACNSLYYIDDMRAGFSANIRECSRILKEGGSFIFSMIGAQHSILSHCKREDEYAILTNDFLGFRDGTILRPLWNPEEMPLLLEGFIIEKSGEILETCEGSVRHLHYFVARKTEQE